MGSVISIDQDSMFNHEKKSEKGSKFNQVFKKIGQHIKRWKIVKKSGNNNKNW